MIEIDFSPAVNVAPRWRDLQPHASASPFLAWEFVGGVVERLSDPWLLAVRRDEADEALAVVNRAAGKLHLHAAGDAALDAVFIEHNGLLVRNGADEVVVPALQHLCDRAPLVMAGVGEAYLAAAQRVGVLTRLQSRFAPCLELASLAGGFVDGLSANTRAQVRRAMRLCGAGLGVEQASGEAALDWFGDMVALHQAGWRARGKPGAFADPAMVAFCAGRLRAGGAEMLRVAGSGGVVGYLYNVRHRGHVCCYQSGFRAVSDGREKPGLVCHSMAVEFYRREGAARYDLLAGATRYKSSLAGSGGAWLHWFTLHRRGAIGARIRVVAERVRARLRGKDGLP